jgi:hypothetical protein
MVGDMTEITSAGPEVGDDVAVPAYEACLAGYREAFGAGTPERGSPVWVRVRLRRQSHPVPPTGDLEGVG